MTWLLLTPPISVMIQLLSVMLQFLSHFSLFLPSRLFLTFQRFSQQTKTKLIRSTMAAPFRSSLQRLGLNHVLAQAIMDQGIVDADSLISLDETAIDALIKHTSKANQNAPQPNVQIRFPFTSLLNLKLYRYWCLTRHCIGLNTELNTFTPAELDFIRALYRERKTLKEATEDVEPTKPEPLKDIKKGWVAFWEHWINYISQLRGAADISLLYVFRPEAEVADADYDAEYADNEACYQRLTMLSGDHYAVDNKVVYNEIKSLVIEGPGWAFIKQYDTSENGREAVLALKAQAEGQSAVLMRKQHAYVII